MHLQQSRGDAPLVYVPFAADTSRLTLEILTPAHAPLLIAGLADPDLYSWLDRSPPDLAALTLRFRKICRRPAPDGQLWLNWALRDRHDGRYVGLVEATIYPDLHALKGRFVSALFHWGRHGRKERRLIGRWKFRIFDQVH